MMDCLILGDSIAVGIASYRQDCQRIAEVGITSNGWLSKFKNKLEPAELVVISLGTNDSGQNTLSHLVSLREKITASVVVWVLPNEVKFPAAAQAVKRAADTWGDYIIAMPLGMISADGVHPTGQGYKFLADQTRSR